MTAVADDPPLTIDEMARHQAWVAADDKKIIAYLLADLVDGGVHVEQVTVHPSHAGRGIGARLIDLAAEWGAARHADRITLTTFAEVAWNAPYYARLGFTVVPDDELTEGLRAIRAAEAAHGLDRWPRVTMSRKIS